MLLRCLLFFFSCLLLPGPAAAQSGLISYLANQVCRCMETTDRVVSPKEQAQNCVLLVGQRNKSALMNELGLNPDNPAQLNLLSERIGELLSHDCPVLSTLSLGKEEREFRWSDRGAIQKAKVEGHRYEFPKNPPADLPSQTVSEPPVRWRVTGRVVGRTRRGTLRLRLADGSLQVLEFPAAVSRKLNLVEGQAITAVCSRQWRKNKTGGIVALVVQAVE